MIKNCNTFLVLMCAVIFGLKKYRNFKHVMSYICKVTLLLGKIFVKYL